MSITGASLHHRSKLARRSSSIVQWDISRFGKESLKPLERQVRVDGVMFVGPVLHVGRRVKRVLALADEDQDVVLALLQDTGANERVVQPIARRRVDDLRPFTGGVDKELKLGIRHSASCADVAMAAGRAVHSCCAPAPPATAASRASSVTRTWTPHPASRRHRLPRERLCRALGVCREKAVEVIANVHIHPGGRIRQSEIDQRNPMVPVAGHTAMIVPNFADARWWSLEKVGVSAGWNELPPFALKRADPFHPPAPPSAESLK